jgi:two-component system, OmpR family, sensor kinase
MSGIASSRAEGRVFLLWSVFAVVNTALMYALPGSETIPFHFVWISLALVYGLSPWSSLRTLIVLVLVCVGTGFALILSAGRNIIGWEELTEVPLMTSVFLATIWHVQRRDRAVIGQRWHLENEIRMREAQRRFVRFASHELRTPLTVARGYTELIIGDAETPQMREDAVVVLEEIAKLQRIASRLIELAHVVEEASAPSPRMVDIDRLLRETVKRWKPTARRRWTVDSSVGYLWVDPDRLVTALDSLLDNATRFTTSDGFIGVSAVRRDGTAVITVRDDGTGLRPDVASKAFHNILTDAPGSHAGLGLLIVRSVVEAHGGTVRAANRPTGGAEFTIALPVEPLAPLPGNDAHMTVK